MHIRRLIRRSYIASSLRMNAIAVCCVLMLVCLILLSAQPVNADQQGLADDSPQARICFVGVWDRAMPLIERASRETGIEVTSYQVDALLEVSQAELAHINIIYILNISADKVEPLKNLLDQARTTHPQLQLVALDQRGSHAALNSAQLLEENPDVRAYWRSNGLQNMRRLLIYTNVHYLGAEGEIEPPSQVPDSGYYLPEKPEEALTDFNDVKQADSWVKDAPTAVLLIHQSFWITQDTKVINAQIKAMRQRGFNTVALFAVNEAKRYEMLNEVQPDLLIEDRHSGAWETAEGKSFLLNLDVPYLRPISMLAYTTEQWLADPSGLHVRDISHFMSLQELNGTVDPIVVGGLKAGISGFRLHEPIPERIERFADRAARWYKLRSTPNSEKKIAIVYYSKSLGKDDLLRGSPTGAFLDGPESLVRLLPRLQERGYMMADLPETAPDLLERLKEHGRNIGPWAQGELDRLADHPDVELIPLDQYLQWFNTLLDEPHRQAVIEKHGPPPGKLMVVHRNDQPYIVIPIVRVGENVILTPQPERAEKQDEKLLHSRDLPPPHNYLAFYWWLQNSFQADAVIHFGTHGSLELLPGKEAGLSSNDWPDICTGNLPIVNLWIMDNLGESTLSRRRSYALLVDHLVPPAVTVKIADETAKLHDDLGKFLTLEQGLIREEYRKQITERAKQQRFIDVLDLKLDDKGLLTESAIDVLHDHLHVVTESRTPTSLHVLGEKVVRDKLADYLTAILGKDYIDQVGIWLSTTQWAHEHDGFVAQAHDHGQESPTSAHTHEHSHNHSHAHDHVADDASEIVVSHSHDDTRERAEALIRQVILEGREAPAGMEKWMDEARDVLSKLDEVDNEITNLLHGLEGGYVEPGPGPDAIRNPGSIPSGRNLYTLNPEEVPTRAAWNVGVRLIDQLLSERQPKKIGIDLNGMNTMRDFGVMESQVLYLMGVRPVWDANRLAIDVELIPSEELGRPRVDVFIAMGGQYKENFPSRVKLLDKAVRLVSELDEENNLVRQGTLATEAKLLEAGYSQERAKQFSLARIFGTKPGNLSGTNILYLVPRSGVWEDESEITNVYIDSMSYAYVGEVWGEKVDGLYEQVIQGTDTLLRVWASNMTSQLSNHHAYEYLGGLNMAVTQLTGKEPAALIADVRDPNEAKIRSFEEVLDTTLRSELLNEDWMRGMMEHDYAGAGQMAELVKNTFGWDVTRDSSVSEAVWDDIYQTYIEDKYELDLEQWFEQVNPHAMQVVMATMMEAARKGYWDASEQQLNELAKRYAESVAKHDLSAGLVAGGNKKLEQALIDRLGKLDMQGLAQAYRAKVRESEGQSEADKVYGSKMDQVDPNQQKQNQQGQKPPQGIILWLLPCMGVLIVILFIIGVVRRSGSAK